MTYYNIFINSLKEKHLDYFKKDLEQTKKDMEQENIIKEYEDFAHDIR